MLAPSLTKGGISPAPNLDIFVLFPRPCCLHQANAFASTLNSYYCGDFTSPASCQAYQQ